MKKTVVGLLFAAAAVAASAAVNVDSLLGEAAMWLDASSPANFEFNGRGGVEKWLNKGSGKATYGDAVAYKVRNQTSGDCSSSVIYGGVQLVDGAPAFQMGASGSDVDLRYERISTIRTVFLVGRFILDDNLEPLLGDDTYFDLHRGKSGYVWNEAWAKDSSGYPGKPTFYLNSATAAVSNPDAAAPVANARNIIAIATAGNTRSNQLSRDRDYVGSRNGARALSEVIIFTRGLTDEERTAVYDYLDAKWNNGGWRNVAGAFAAPAASTFTLDETVGSAGSTYSLPGELYVESGATATFGAPVYAADLQFKGGGTLAFANGVHASGRITQTGGALDLGGGVYNVIGNPALSGDVVWKNGTFHLDFWAEFRPAQGVTLTLADGAGLRKSTYWRTFIDKGMTLVLAEGAGVSEIAGPFVVTCDSNTDNYLDIRGGTLVVTNATDGNKVGRDITIGTQQKGGRGFMTMTGGRVVTRRLRVAAGWDNDTTGVTSSGTVNIGGGTVELQDKFVFGANSTTRSLATVNFNGGEAICPNGFLMYDDDIDVVTFNGTTFKVNEDCAKYFDFRKNSAENVTIAAGGFLLDVAAGKTVALGWGPKGVGGVSKSGAGTLVLDRDATFAGGVDVQSGTLIARTSGSLGTGVVKVAAGATAEIAGGSQATLAADCAGTIKVVITSGGKQRIIGVASGFSVENVTTITQDANGIVVPSAVLTVEDGALYVTTHADFAAALVDVTNGAWYSLPWTSGGAAASYPTAFGEVMKAMFVATGNNIVSMDANAYAGLLKITNGVDVTEARVVLAGDHQLTAAVDATGTTAEFGVAGPNALQGQVLLPANGNFLVYAAAGEEWDIAGATFTLADITSKFKKIGAGRVTYPGLPDHAIISEEGSFAFKVDQDVSSGALNLTGAGTKEKFGAGTLTITGGTFGGAFAVTEGQVTINGSILGFSSLYVGEGAKAYIPHCSQVNNRLPQNGQVVVDGGEIHVCGVNPFSSHIPEFWLTNGMLRVDCATGSEHIKFKNIHMKDSTFRLQGAKGAYQNNGIYFFSNSGKFFIDGECAFEAAEGIPNAIHGEAAVPVVVSEGSSVVWGTPFMQNIAKTGPGAVRFADTVDQTKCTATFLMQEGTLLTGSRVPRLNISAGTIVRPLGGAPLTVTTTLTLPENGSVAVDLSAIDFAGREAPVRILAYSGFTETMGSRFAFSSIPEGWTVASVGGLSLVKAKQPKHIYWNTQSGEWGERQWNQDPEGYNGDGYHEVTFEDSTNGVATALTTVDVSGDRTVISLDFDTEETPYLFTGAGSITVPTFSAGTVGAGYEIDVPLYIGLGGLTFAATTQDQTIGDIRGTIGAITVPAADGGMVKVNFSNSSPRNPGAITIGAGKTLEFSLGYTTGASVVPAAPMVSDSTSKFILSTQGGNMHMDITQNSPNFKGEVEIRDGAFLHVNAQFNGFTATAERPVRVHGENSILSLYGSQVFNRLPDNAYVYVYDGGRIMFRGVNVTQQVESPWLVVSNGVVEATSEMKSHLHTRIAGMHGESEIVFSGTGATYNNDGIVVHSALSVLSGTTTVHRASGSSAKLAFQNDPDYNVPGVLQVEDGALLRIAVPLKQPPVKKGGGTLELLEGAKLGDSGNSLTLQEGYLKVNDLANALGSVSASSGTGLDLTDEDSVYQPADDAFAATGVIKLKTGARQLGKGEYLFKWKVGHAPSCSFALESTAADRDRFRLEKVADGVIVGTKFFAILVR
ncbi:MAG: hypothetical protein IKL96_10560 [Kiritimatiellae bacterium]|nr:hypothetical protein [Kiritimatiellia bacterium]